MRTAIFTVAAALFALSFAQQPKFDNSKLQPLIGDWVGTAGMNDSPQEASTMKGSKILKDTWIQVDLRFTIPEMGPIEAVGLLCSNDEGVVEGHFFASFAPDGLYGKGKVVDKKLTLNVTSLAGESNMVFVFDMSKPDELAFSATSTEGRNEAIIGTYKRKK
jgi:hypothetical protein